MRILSATVLLLLAAGLSAAPEDAFDREIEDIESEWLDAGADRDASRLVRRRMVRLEARGPFRPRFWSLWGRISHAAGEFRAATLGFTIATRMGFEPRVTRERLARSLLSWLLEKSPKESATRHILIQDLERARKLVVAVLDDPATRPATRTEFERLEFQGLEALGTANHLARNAAETLVICRELVRRRPKDPWYRMSLARAYISHRQWEKALESVRIARELNPDRNWTTVHAALGTIHSNLDHPELAEQHYARFLAEYPENARVLKRLGEHYYRNQQFGPGVEIYRRLAELEPNKPTTYQMLATGLRHLGKTEEAAKCEEIYRRKEGRSAIHRPPNRKR